MTIGMRRERVAAWTAGWVAGALVLTTTAACSSSGGPDTAGPNATNQTSAAAPSSPAATGAGSGSGTPADAATSAAIKKAYGQFFSGTAAPAVSQQALQHGEAFKQVLEAQAKGQYSKGSSVQVTAITVNGPVAFVTFTLLSNGKVLLPNIKGNAVQDGGTWKVAAATFCLLLKLQGNPPSACSDASITALPK